MSYKKVKVKFVTQTRYLDDAGVMKVRRRTKTKDYIQKKTKKAIYQAPDTDAGKASLDSRKS